MPMPKRKPAPSLEELDAAIASAQRGKGRKLAEIVKSFSTDDLATAFGRIGGKYPHMFHGLYLALSFASGLKEERANQAAFCRQWTLKQRAKV